MPNRIHPTAVLGSRVQLGEDTVIGPYSVILGPCRIGDGNWIGPHVAIGGPPEYPAGSHPGDWEELDGAGVEIGHGNVLRESVIITQGLHRPTVLGDRCYVMGAAHVAHDAVIEDGVILTSGVQVAGHCHVWTWANIGLGTVLHQFSRVGPGAMVGMASAIRKEVAAFTTAVGNPARTVGVNAVGLSRHGCDEEQIKAVEEYLKGKVEVPDGLPPDVALLLKRWEDRPE